MINLGKVDVKDVIRAAYDNSNVNVFNMNPIDSQINENSLDRVYESGYNSRWWPIDTIDGKLISLDIVEHSNGDVVIDITQDYWEGHTQYDIEEFLYELGFRLL